MKSQWLMHTGRVISTNNMQFLICFSEKIHLEVNSLYLLDWKNASNFWKDLGIPQMVKIQYEILKAFYQIFIVFSVDLDINYLKTILPSNVEAEFYDYLSKITAKDVTMYAIAEGTVVFPKVPLIRVEGPLPVVQLLETTLLNLVNYAR